MEQDPHRRLPGDDDPLDAALGELHDLAELERSFADLDARLGDGVAARRAGSDDDPFADIAAALREHRAHQAEPVDGAAPVARDDEDERSADGDDDSRFGDATGELDAELAVEIEQRCQDALDALDEDDLARARELAMDAVRMDDEHPFPTFVLGLVAERDGDLDTARDMAELALRSAETNPDAIGLRAHIHVAQHELDEADALLRFGIAHNPDEALLHEGLARVSLARGAHDAALAAANAALRIDPACSGALSVRAAAMDSSRDRTAVLASLRQGVLLNPDDPYGMLELASMEVEQGNLSRARTLLMRAARLAPDDPEIGEVRILLDELHEHRLLRPVPSLLRWLRAFPGGYVGFVLGFAVAALPLHALATTQPQYGVAAVAELGAWGLAALYALVAPARLTHRLNQRAARGALDRLEPALADPDAARLLTTERVVDVLSMLLDARDRRRAAHLALRLAGVARTSDLVVGLQELSGQLRGVRARVALSPLTAPGLDRLLLAVGSAALLAAPALAQTVDQTSRTGWTSLGIGALLAAWLVRATSRRATERLRRDVDALALLDEPAGSAPVVATRRRRGA